MTENSTATELSYALLYGSLLGFAVVSWLLWKFVLSPPPPPRAGTTSSSSSSGAVAGSSRTTGASSSSSSSAAVPPRSRRSGGMTALSSSSKGAEEDGTMSSFGLPRHPPHLVAPAGWSTTKSDLSACLLHGVVPFRSTPASGYEARLQRESKAKEGGDDGDTIVANRRERARVFARMFSLQKGGGQKRPPNRGANVVVAIGSADVHCRRLQKALYLLGTYYNLFVLIDSSGDAASSSSASIDGEGETRNFIKGLRSDLLNDKVPPSTTTTTKGDDDGEYKLNAQILPPHRIASCSTRGGRVAFVRQLQGTELVVDFEEGVTGELERFGFRVLLYPENGNCEEGETISALGKCLIP